MLWMLYLIHDPAATPDMIIADVDAEIARLQATSIARGTRPRAHEAARSLYDLAGSSTPSAFSTCSPALRCSTTTRPHQPAGSRLPRRAARAHPRRRAQVPDSFAPHGADRLPGRRLRRQLAMRSLAALSCC
jgi:hypothetical protein